MKLRCRTLRVRRGRWTRALGIGTGLLALLLSPGLSTGQLWLVAVFGACATIAAAVFAAERKRNNVELDVDPKTIEDGYEAGTSLVLHTTNGGRIDAELDDQKPRKVLDELGLTLDQRALSAPLRGVLGGFTRGLLAFIATMMFATCASIPLNSPGFTAIVPLLLGVAAAIAVPRWLRPRVIVGLDGLRIVGVLRPKFVPYAKVQSAGRVLFHQNAGPAIVLETADGPVTLPVVGQSNEQIDALIARIARGRKRYEESAARSLDTLDRAGRSMKDWLEALRRLPTTGSFREAALDPADLVAVVADPKAPLERRLGAALALREDGDARQRIRIAAEQSADPRVRVALEAASADEIDEGEIENALRR